LLGSQDESLREHTAAEDPGRRLVPQHDRLTTINTPSYSRRIRRTGASLLQRDLRTDAPATTIRRVRQPPPDPVKPAPPSISGRCRFSCKPPNSSPHRMYRQRPCRHTNKRAGRRNRRRHSRLGRRSRRRCRRYSPARAR